MAIALVGSQAVSGKATATTLTLTLPSNPVTGGTSFIVVVVVASALTVSTVASTNDTYTRAIRVQDSLIVDYVDIWYAAGIAGGANSKSIVVTPSASASVAGWAWEFSSVTTSSALDQYGGSTTSLAPGSQTPSVANELWISGALNRTNALTAPTSWTDGGNLNPVGILQADGGYFIQSGSGAINPTWQGTANEPCSAMASFKPVVVVPSYFAHRPPSFVSLNRAASW
jgi:hypothetical protein